MKAIPSIAFSEFRGSAKGVTARIVNGRQVLSNRALQPRMATDAQVVRRSAFAIMAKGYRRLADRQMEDWESLADRMKGASVFGEPASLTAHNAFMRLNSNRALVGETSLLADAPEYRSVPAVRYSAFGISNDMLLLQGIQTEGAEGCSLVLNLSATKESGDINKTVILDSSEIDGGEDLDLTGFLADTSTFARASAISMLGLDCLSAEFRWIDPVTGFAGPTEKVTLSMLTGDEENEDNPPVTPPAEPEDPENPPTEPEDPNEGGDENGEDEEPEQRMHFTIDDLNTTMRSGVSAIDLDFSTGSPLLALSATCEGTGSMAASFVYFNADADLPHGSSTLNTYVLGRGKDASGRLCAQTYSTTIRRGNSKDGNNVALMQLYRRGGRYVKPTDIFGGGPLY